MADVSVRTAWEMLLPAGTQLIAGEAGLDRPVTWPVVLRTHPPAFDPLRGGELAIVPLDRLHLLDSALTLGRVVTSLARIRIGAVCAIGPIGDDAVQAAGAADVPLFRLPDGSSATEVHQAFMRALAEHRVQLSQRVAEIGRELTTLAIEGRGRPAIARRAGQLADAVTALEDETGEIVSVYTPPGGKLDRGAVGRLMAELPHAAGSHHLNGHVSALVATIRSQVRAAGRLVMLASGRALVGLDAAILEQASAACAVDLAREDAVLSAREEIHGDFLDDLLAGEFESGEAIERRGRGLGYELTRQHAVLAVVFEPGFAAANEPVVTDEQVVAVADALAAEVGAPAAARARWGAAVALAQADDAAPLAGALARRFAGAAIGYGAIATGGVAIAAAAERAAAAATIGGRLNGPGSQTAFEELGLHRLLFGLRRSPEVVQFHQEMLGALIEHDRRAGGELLRTLDAYLAAGCSPTAAAERLHLHRNGLLYRLQRIRELVPLSLDDPERRVALHVALRIGDLLDPASSLSA